MPKIKGSKFDDYLVATEAKREKLIGRGGDDTFSAKLADRTDRFLGNGGDDLVEGVVATLSGGRIKYDAGKVNFLGGSGFDTLSVELHVGDDARTVLRGPGGTQKSVELIEYRLSNFNGSSAGLADAPNIVGTGRDEAVIIEGLGRSVDSTLGGYWSPSTLKLDMGGGDDLFGIKDGVHSGNLSTTRVTLKMGGGDDRVALGSAADGSTVNLGRGDDILFSGRDRMVQTFKGGAGDDAFVFDGFGGYGQMTDVVRTGTGKDSIVLGAMDFWTGKIANVTDFSKKKDKFVIEGDRDAFVFAEDDPGQFDYGNLWFSRSEGVLYWDDRAVIDLGGREQLTMKNFEFVDSLDDYYL